MTKKALLDFMNENSAAILCTSWANKPHVRYMWTISSNEEGVLFHTGGFKDVFSQLTANPQVELLFANSEKNLQIRVEGQAKAYGEESFKETLVEQRPFLKPIQEKFGNLDWLNVFQVTYQKISLWSLETNKKEEITSLLV